MIKFPFRDHTTFDGESISAPAGNFRCVFPGIDRGTRLHQFNGFIQTVPSVLSRLDSDGIDVPV
jgi:hypothetical protein